MAKQRSTPSARKQPLGEDSDRRPRAGRGRTGPAETPVELRSPGLELNERVEPFVREKLGEKLSAFAEQIERVTVTFRDVNGPKGGEDIECTLRVVLIGRPDQVVRETGTNAQRAFESAHRRVGQAVKRDLQRHGISVGHRGARARPPEREAQSSVEDEQGGSTIPAASARRSTTKAPPGARAGENLAKRARERAHTPKAHAETSKVRRKGK